MLFIRCGECGGNRLDSNHKAYCHVEPLHGHIDELTRMEHTESVIDWIASQPAEMRSMLELLERTGER